MITEILVRYVHFIALFVWIGALTSEHLLLKPQMSRAEIARLARIDAVYGLSAVLVVAAGLTLWFGVGKPADFYSSNWIFHTKVGLAIIVGFIIYLSHRIFYQKPKRPRR